MAGRRWQLARSRSYNRQNSGWIRSIFARPSQSPEGFRVDFGEGRAQKQCEVFEVSTSSYARWRLQGAASGLLHEGQEPPPERLLQAVWQHQRLHRDRLKTVDGRPVRVIHPGFGSVEGGPDFRDALIQIGSEPPRTGDVEIDLQPAGWRAHGHDRNPSFKNVILHVVWEGQRTTAGAPPLLPIGDSLDAPIAELGLWLEGEPARTLPEQFRGRCSAPLRELDSARLETLLQDAALTRLQAKAAQLRARARQAGWEQALWEGLFRALGYKNNSWPMLHLAETRERWHRRNDTVLTLQARLLGLGGLLPVDLKRNTSGNGYPRQVWDSWWRERDEFEDCLLPRAAWKFHGLRPANHPQRRLALAAHWLLSEKLPARLQRWCADTPADNRLPASLLEILQAPRDEFWSWHWNFRTARLGKPQPLVGEKRVTDLAINVILPWLWTRADGGRNRKLQTEIVRRYFAWPAAEDNSMLRLARQRLLGGSGRNALRTAASQQGLLQIIRDFCDHSNAACEKCRFPELVKEWAG